MGNKPYKTVIHKNRDKCWYFKGNLHRVDGPAVEYHNGDREWYFNDKQHRDDGPAFEGSNGDREWWIHGYRHRRDGPAVEWADGDLEWWYKNVRESRKKNRAREKCRIMYMFKNIKICLPVESSRSRFPLVDLVIAYS
jgi:hypothetical protein